ncbi:TPA: transcriptional regulator [Escherichia coli]|nr:transcriptional regulator [Escherichia coli]HBD5220740.1 transcriptional regulator [Escherichia coli]HBD5287473.1 transcriptional regulator [Escherichia coli]
MLSKHDNTTLQRPSMDSLIDMKFITSDCLLSDKWIYRLISLNRSPKPIKIGRMSRWRAADYYKWRDGFEENSGQQFEGMRNKARAINKGNRLSPTP